MKYNISNDKKTLTIEFTAKERANLRALETEGRNSIQTESALYDCLEPLTCNSELQWINPVDTGDLTSAPMLGILGEEIPFTKEAATIPHVVTCPNLIQPILARWAFMDYALRSPLEDLRDTGNAVFTGGELSPEPGRNNHLEQAEAGYRIALKRIIRSARGHVDNDAATAQLETAVREIAKAAPCVVARGVEKWFEQAAKALEQGNNSDKSEIMLAKQAECDRLRDRAERVLKLWGVRVDYPGLHPSFNWRGGDYHSCESLLNWISKAEVDAEIVAAREESIYAKMLAAGVKIASHETDLYVPVNDITRGILADYKFKSNVTTFTNQVEGGLWFDIPFAYLPAWEKKGGMK